MGTSSARLEALERSVQIRGLRTFSEQCSAGLPLEISTIGRPVLKSKFFALKTTVVISCRP